MNLTNLTSPLKEQTGSISKRSNLNGTRIGNSYQTRKEKYLVDFFFQQKQPLVSASSVERSVDGLVEKALKEIGTDWNLLLHTMFQYDIWKDNLANSNQYFAESLKDLEDVLNSTIANDDDKLFTTAEKGELYCRQNMLYEALIDLEYVLAQNPHTILYQTTINLYSQNLTTIILLRIPNDCPEYKLVFF
ncbi:unnamed protein product [Rhizophagus irregularis]|nr:unnamed protein product [Rhizophagus irregularis]CAB5210427.1 unnamed protein product [Rhizophagus irregularis]